jgi:hypothetical protein
MRINKGKPFFCVSRMSAATALNWREYAAKAYAAATRDYPSKAPVAITLCYPTYSRQ